MCVCIHVCRYQQRQEESVRPSRTGGYDVPSVGAEDQTQVFYKISICSLLLSH